MGDRVQLDPLIPSPRGDLAARHGRLLSRGTTRIALAPGHYFFKTLSDAHLRVSAGGVVARRAADAKNGGPDPRDVGGHLPLPAPRDAGDAPAGQPPRFTMD